MKRTPQLAAFAAGILLHLTTATGQISQGGTPWVEGARPEPMTLPVLDRAALAAEDDVTDRYKEAPWRFGVDHEVALSPVTDGAWTVEQGERVWRLVIAAPGATCLSVRFDRFAVPKGGQLFLYAANGSDVLGAFEHEALGWPGHRRGGHGRTGG